MDLKVLAIGRINLIRHLSASLNGTGIELFPQSDISSAINQLRKDKFDMALVDGSLKDLESICHRLIWQARTPVVLSTNGAQTNWQLFQNLEVEGFIPEIAGTAELVAIFSSIAGRRYFRPDQTRILIIEDDEPTQEVLRLAFQFYWPDARLSFASNGMNGVALASGGNVDLVVLDLMLPDISGFEVLHQIRSFSQLPVIIITSTRRQEDILKCIQLGANDFVLKPFKQLELLSRIKQVITLGTAVSRV